MSLDVYLMSSEKDACAIYVREHGRMREISREEWSRRYPGRKPAYLIRDECVLYKGNITHNLSRMARAVGIEMHLWEPEGIGIDRAGDLIGPLEEGLKKLRSNPDEFRKYNPENGWSDYDVFVAFVEEYLSACRGNPNAVVRVSG